MKIFLLAGLFLVLTGCGVNSTFVYKPGAPTAGGPKHPMKVAVLPFADGTENFTSRGGIFDQENFFYNLAKAGYGGVITAIPPEMWAKAFAEEMATSGAFRSVRFVYSPSEILDEELRIEGTVEKATFAGAFGYPSEFTLGLRATRLAGGNPVWEKRVSRKWVNQQALYEGCGPMSIQCMVDRHHADTNRVMREMFAEATADLIRTLEPISGGRSVQDAPKSAATPAPQPESVDETIENILRGQ